MKAFYNGQTMTIKLNGKGIGFYFNVTDLNNELITADGLKFLTADGNKFLVKEG